MSPPQLIQHLLVTTLHRSMTPMNSYGLVLSLLITHSKNYMIPKVFLLLLTFLLLYTSNYLINNFKLNGHKIKAYEQEFDVNHITFFNASSQHSSSFAIITDRINIVLGM